MTTPNHPAAPTRPPRIGFVSLGCPKATVDSERGSASTRMFSEVDEAVDWLAARLGAAGVTVDPAALREVAQKLCARQPEPGAALRS